MSLSLRHLASALLLACLLPTALCAQPQPLPQPSGPIILTVSGAITQTNHGETAQFDLAMLEALGSQTLATTTPWTVGVQNFDVVPLKAVLDRVGATGDLVFAEAYNDYNSEIPVADASDPGAFVAFRIDGKEMTLRDKGPLWVVYPYDDDPLYLTELYLTRSIWHLDRLTIKSNERSAP